MQNTEEVKVENNGNNQQAMGNQVKVEQKANQQANNLNQTKDIVQVQNNAQTQPQAQKPNKQPNQLNQLKQPKQPKQPNQVKAPQQNPPPNSQTPNPTNMYSIQTSQTQKPKQQQHQQSQQPQPKQQQSQTTLTQTKRFTVELSSYLITFELNNNQLIIKAEQQTGRQSLQSYFMYEDFTEQMKALFQTTEEMWAILETAQEYLFFQDSKLYFKILIGQVSKRIHIPLNHHDSTDHEYIDKLQRVVEKHKDLSKKLTHDIQNQLTACTCKHNTQKIPEIQNKDINPKAKGKIKIDRNWLSRASSTWPQPPLNFNQKSDHQPQPNPDLQSSDPLIQFQQLMQKLNTMRNQFNLLAQQIEHKVLNSASLKILRLKLMGLQKKKKDYFYELDLEKIKFANLKCRNDIYIQIDDFLTDIRARYTQIQTTVNLIRDEK